MTNSSLGLGHALRAVVQREGPEHLAAARDDRRRPAGAQPVGCRKLDPGGRQRIAGHVEHDDRLAPVRRGAADALAFADLQAIHRLVERARQARRGGGAQHAARAANRLVQQDRGEHARRVRLGDVQQLRQRLRQRRACGDQLEHGLLAVAPALLALGHRARRAQLELGRGGDRELLDELGVVRGPAARQRVGDAEAAEHVAGAVDQRRADERDRVRMLEALLAAAVVLDDLQRARRDDALAQRVDARGLAPAPQPVTAVMTWLSALTSDTSASGARNAFAAQRVRRSRAALAKTSSAGSEASPLSCGPMIDLASTWHCIGRRVRQP